MPYRVLGDEVSIYKALGEFYDSKGERIGYDHDSIIYLKDEIVADDDVSPDVVNLYDSKDPKDADAKARMRSLIVRVDAKGKLVDVPAPAKEAERPAPVVVKNQDGDFQTTPIAPPEGLSGPAKKTTAAKEQ